MKILGTRFSWYMIFGLIRVRSLTKAAADIFQKPMQLGTTAVRSFKSSPSGQTASESHVDYAKTRTPVLEQDRSYRKAFKKSSFTLNALRKSQCRNLHLLGKELQKHRISMYLQYPSALEF